MASDNFIQLGKLNFDDIKSSIKQFLESQSELDYDFNGSIISNVVDLLAYNTMYYAFYSNMLINESFLDSAQRLDSLISLVKPFGTLIIASFPSRPTRTACLNQVVKLALLIDSSSSDNTACHIFS